MDDAARASALPAKDQNSVIAAVTTVTADPKMTTAAIHVNEVSDDAQLT